MEVRALAAAAVVAVCGCVSVLAMTRDGAGATVDSGEYLAVADNLAHGKGFTMPYVGYDEAYPERLDAPLRVPLTQFPPVFPAVVAAGERLSGAEPTSVARWVNAFALAGTVGVAALLVYGATGVLLWEVLAGALLVRPPFVFAHARLLSEPLALLSLALVVATTCEYLERPRRSTLIALAVAAAVGALTRLPGVVPAGCAAIAIALWSAGDTRRRALRAGGVVAVSLLPLAAWLIRNTLATGKPGDRSLGFHPPGAGLWRESADKWLAWFGPHHLPWSAATLIGVALLTAWAARNTWRVRPHLLNGPPSLPRLCLFFAAAYAVFVLAVRTFIDNNLSFGSRMFLPVLLLATIGVASAAATATRRTQRVVVALGGALCAWSTVALVGTNIPRFPHSSSSGYASHAWRSSPALAYVAGLDDDVVVVTNAPDPIWLHTSKAPLFIPLERDLFSGDRNQRYDEQLGALRRATDDRPVVLVFFDFPTRRTTPRALNKQVTEALGVTVLRRYPDATVYSSGMAE